MKKIIFILSLIVIAIVIIINKPFNNNLSPKESGSEKSEDIFSENTNKNDSEMVTPIIGDQDDTIDNNPIANFETNVVTQSESTNTNETANEDTSEDVIQLPVLD